MLTEHISSVCDWPKTVAAKIGTSHNPYFLNHMQKITRTFSFCELLHIQNLACERSISEIHYSEVVLNRLT